MTALLLCVMLLASLSVRAYAQEPKNEPVTIRFVTHEIDEAFTVASRIAVLSRRPSSVQKGLELPGENGRDCADPCLSTIRREIHALVSGASGT